MCGGRLIPGVPFFNALTVYFTQPSGKIPVAVIRSCPIG